MFKIVCMREFLLVAAAALFAGPCFANGPFAGDGGSDQMNGVFNEMRAVRTQYLGRQAPSQAPVPAPPVWNKSLEPLAAGAKPTTVSLREIYNRQRQVMKASLGGKTVWLGITFDAKLAAEPKKAAYLTVQEEGGTPQYFGIRSLAYNYQTLEFGGQNYLLKINICFKHLLLCDDGEHSIQFVNIQTQAVDFEVKIKEMQAGTFGVGTQWGNADFALFYGDPIPTNGVPGQVGLAVVKGGNYLANYVHLPEIPKDPDHVLRVTLDGKRVVDLQLDPANPDQLLVY